MKRKVVVTGTGAVSPYGYGSGQLQRGWATGESRIEDGVARCDFAPEDHLSRREQRRYDRFAQLALVAADEATEQAGWSELPCDGGRIGSIVGSGFGGVFTADAAHDALVTRGPQAINPASIPKMMTNAPAAALAMRYGLHGDVYQTGSACASSATAIGAAMRAIQCGDMDACVVAGAEACLTEFTLAAFRASGVVSSTGVARPFDARRDGFCMGEGAAVLVLEAEELAAARGAAICAELLGYGATADGFHLTNPDPSGQHAAQAITAALGEAGARPEDVAYVSAHATGTKPGDIAETRALKRALGDAVARGVPVSALKSAIGHLLAASAATAVVTLIETLAAGVAPPTLAYEQPDPECDLDYVPGGARPLASANGHGRVGLANSFGFGGHNAAICIRVGRG